MIPYKMTQKKRLGRRLRPVDLKLRTVEAEQVEHHLGPVNFPLPSSISGGETISKPPV
jgi:hypothetical protein